MKHTTFRKKHRISKADFDQLLELGLPTIGNDQLNEDTVLRWLESKASRGKLIATKVEASNVLGVSTTTLRNWELKHANMPKFPCYEEDLRDFVDSIRSNPELTVVDPNAPPAPDDRYRTAKAELAEVTLAERTGELVPLQGMLDLIRRSTARHKAILVAFPDRLAKEFRTMGFDRDKVEHVRSQCSEMIDDLCDQIARDLIEQREEDTAEEDEEQPIEA